MKIGILGAMEEEIRLLTQQISNKRSEIIGKREYINGQLANHDVCLVFSRWGKVAAASTATTLVQRYGVERLIFTGVAGGIDPTLNIGDIVVADNLVQHDMDVSFLPDMAEFEIPLLGVSDFRVREKDVQTAIQAVTTYLHVDLPQQVAQETLASFSITRPQVVRGTIASGDQFISSSAQTARLKEKIPGLRCVEMEGAAVAQVACEHDIPCLVLRTISDKANHEALADIPRFIASVASFFTCGSVLRLLERLKEQEIKKAHTGT